MKKNQKGKKKGPVQSRYGHGKQTEPIDFATFKNIMENGRFTKNKSLRDKSLMAFFYWFGVRRSEALERVVEDFKIKDGLLIVDAPPKKGGSRESLEIPVDYPYVDLILKQIEKVRRSHVTLKKPIKRVWNISPATAWRIVKRVMPKHYPHYFRLNRATRFLSDPDTTLPEMMAWFGWLHAKTVDPYIGYSRKYIKTQRKRLARELEEPT